MVAAKIRSALLLSTLINVGLFLLAFRFSGHRFLDGHSQGIPPLVAHTYSSICRVPRTFAYATSPTINPAINTNESADASG